MSELDTKALRALQAEATPGEIMVYDSCSWMRIGLADRHREILWPTKAPDGHPDLAGVNRDADLAWWCALVNAAPALLDELDTLRQQVLDLGEDVTKIEVRAEEAEAEVVDLRKRFESDNAFLNERIDKLSRRVSYYEGALCSKPPRLFALPPDGVMTGHVEPERVGDVMRERDALKAEVERLREAWAGVVDDINSLRGRPTAIDSELGTHERGGGPWITKGAAIEIVRAAISTPAQDEGGKRGD